MLEQALKTSCLLLTAIAVHLSLSPPNPPVKAEECRGQEKLFERFVRSITFISKSMVWIGIICDLLAATLAFHDPTLSQHTCPGVPSFPLTAWSVHAVMLAGTLSAVTGAVLRLWCFKSLGSLFTFEVTIAPKHELITSGPYAWVRHPSYTGIYLTLLGATAVLCAPGTWLSECGASSRGGAVALGLWLLKCAFVSKGMSARVIAEEEALHRLFGGQWDAYAARTPYRFLPGII